METNAGKADEITAAHPVVQAATEAIRNADNLINGVPEDRWGTWCAHGKRIVEPDPDRDPDDPYPAGRIVDPWPCDADGCTRIEYLRECAEAEAEYYASIEGMCPDEYEREGGREPGDRIVRCHLPAGHPGEHEEADTEVTWISEPTCDGLCVYAADIGIAAGGVAYPHPGCPLHDPGEVCKCGQPDRCLSPTHGQVSMADALEIRHRQGGPIVVDQPSGYTEADAQLVAEMIEHPLRVIDGTTVRPADAEVQAAAILAALAAAGRLLPAEAKIETDWGVRWPDGMVCGGYVFEGAARAHATDKMVNPHGEAVQRSIWVGPWVPVDPPKEGEDRA